ncbi:MULTISPECIES: membrane protein insertion efficiency factor YidD [unclassified Janthinobacterium]|uniref:membrane protein insertion efficiency factor YidD n=1 Tax=unclassified Janthinobacterium TaxID=2610881 RepID=UPI0008812BCA|nr:MULTISPECIES: membrane protein insertion efficiency factor YidD [unclassified Janthinobacterium]SDA42718.1 Haemolytic domain-containing protein [Janthinobacterium sp. 551a]SFA89735.1 Haemolytic domain-containing protein [Janthinobacterium sp. 344]
MAMPLAAAIGMTCSPWKTGPSRPLSVTEPPRAILPICHIDNSWPLDAMLLRIAVVCSKHWLTAIRKGPIIFTLDTCGKHLALWTIRAYQRYLSPWKGFSCAYRVLTGRDSCSAYGYKVIARHGLRAGLPLLQRRLRACGERHRQHLARQPQARHRARRQAQAGYCDCDLPCDLPSMDCLDKACGAADIVDCCDWPWQKKKDHRH